MFGNDLNELWGEVKQFASLQMSYAKLTFVEKLIMLLSMMVVTFVCVLLGVCALFYLSLLMLDILEAWLESVWMAHLVLAAFFALIIFLFLHYKRVLVVRPISKIVTKLLLTPNDFNNEKK